MVRPMKPSRSFVDSPPTTTASNCCSAGQCRCPAARNTAILASRGAYIAPIDADDLWHPTKLAKQMQVFAANDEEMGLVYTLFRSIDRDGRVTVIPTWTSSGGLGVHSAYRPELHRQGIPHLSGATCSSKWEAKTSKLRKSGAEGCGFSSAARHRLEVPLWRCSGASGRLQAHTRQHVARFRPHPDLAAHVSRAS